MDEAKRVLETYGTIVYRVCLVKLAGFDPTLADDAYQNTFLTWMCWWMAPLWRRRRICRCASVALKISG